ncbi:MAG: pyridoxal phosphate-dependent aminotransferase [Solirubrobacteraceae bacterium]
MGLLDYYKQFEALSEEEVNRGLREEAAERKARELAKLPELDLSQTTWPDAPHPDVVSALTFVARRGLHRYPRSSELTSELAHRHDLDVARIALGNGASELLQAAACALMRPGQALLSSWPSYPLFPAIARRAHGVAVPVSGGVDALLAASAEHDTRVIALASPNDPTGELLPFAELERLLGSLDEGVAVLLDEALIEYAGGEAESVSPRLLERFPRLLVFRSFSKAWGLAGLRCGYAICGPGAEGVLASLAPAHGVSELAQAAALESLRSCERVLARRVASVAEQRERLTGELRARGMECAGSAANFLWVAHERMDGGELTAELRALGVLVASGAPLGEPRHMRISIRDAAASARLLSALDNVLAGR